MLPNKWRSRHRMFRLGPPLLRKKIKWLKRAEFLQAGVNCTFFDELLKDQRIQNYKPYKCLQSFLAGNVVLFL
jgi:hypothetical protein